MNAQTRRELQSLVSALCDGVIDAQQHRRLEEQLRGSAACRRVYLEYLDMHARLTVHPNLATGIPLGDASPGSAPSPDDEVVLELARDSLRSFADEIGPVRRRRKRTLFARWLAAAFVIGAAVVGWRWYVAAQDAREYPVLGGVAGDVTIETAGVSHDAAAGRPLSPGDRLRLGDDEAMAQLQYADGTSIVVCFDSVVEVPANEYHVHLRLLSGTMEVDAAPQRPDRPLIFATDHARYVVLGTKFRLYREAAATRLELDEGKVRLERQVDGQALEVKAGYVAVATSSRAAPLESKPIAAGRSRLRATLRKAGGGVAFKADGSRLATSDWQRGLRTWAPDKSAPRHTAPGKVGRSAGLAFADDTLVQVNSAKRQGALTIWQPGASPARSVSLSEENVRSRALSPDGLFVAESSEDGIRIDRIDLTRAQREHLAELPGKGKAWCLALSPAARFAAAGFWDGTVRVYAVASEGNGADQASSIAFETRLKHTPTQIALSADGKLLAVFTHKDGLLLIDMTSQQPRLVWAAGAASVTCLKFTPDGGRVIAGMNDRTARMWSVADGQALLVVDTGQVARDIAWSPENSLLATAAGTVQLWECEIP